MLLPEPLHPLTRLRTWRRGDERAPHKPLLVLYALGRLARGDSSPIPFRDVDADLRALLREFGQPRHSDHPEYPFWRLRSDGVWDVEMSRELADRVAEQEGGRSPTRGQLLKHDAHGAFKPEVIDAFTQNRDAMRTVAMQLLGEHFPPTLHEDILQAVGLDLSDVGAERVSFVERRPRDPSFRLRVLAAYGSCCAVCAMDLRLLQRPVALDAAHIKWHGAGGPDEERNGLALCSLHHKVFDLGAFTVDASSHQVLVSDLIHGDEASLERVLKRHHGQRLRAPLERAHRPSPEFLTWHRDQVFKGEPRDVA